jgi:sigma-E factor negative regulatory protein RseB
MRQPLRLRCRKRGSGFHASTTQPSGQLPGHHGLQQRGWPLSSSRVWHYCVGEQTYERWRRWMAASSTSCATTTRCTRCGRRARVAVVEKRETLAAWSTTPQSVDPQALEQYELRREGLTRVAGREAVVLLLEPRDALRYAQRLWADAASGLMLRADVMDLGRDGRRAACSSRPRFPKSRSVFARSPNKCCRPCGARRLQAAAAAAATHLAGGRRLGAGPPGGGLPACGLHAPSHGNRGGRRPGAAKRVLRRPDPRVAVRRAFQADFHRRDAGPAGRHGHVMLRRGEHWVTVVGDVPPATLKLFADALERRPDAG